MTSYDSSLGGVSGSSVNNKVDVMAIDWPCTTVIYGCSVKIKRKKISVTDFHLKKGSKKIFCAFWPGQKAKNGLRLALHHGHIYGCSVKIKSKKNSGGWGIRNWIFGY